MAGRRAILESMRQVFILIVGVFGLVGVEFVVASVMAEGLSHFAVGRRRFIIKSRAKPTARRRP